MQTPLCAKYGGTEPKTIEVYYEENPVRTAKLAKTPCPKCSSSSSIFPGKIPGHPTYWVKIFKRAESGRTLRLF